MFLCAPTAIPSQQRAHEVIMAAVGADACGRRTTDQKSFFEPTEAEVMEAVVSVAADELRPFGRVILKRLRENAAAAVARERGLSTEEVSPESMPRIDPKWP